MAFNYSLDCFRNFSVYQLAFFVGILGGIFGVLVDLDHIPSIFWSGLQNRLFHFPMLIIAGGVAFCCTAHLGRLYSQLVVRKKMDELNYINPQRSEHLKKDVRPIIACVDTFKNAYKFEQNDLFTGGRSDDEYINYWWDDWQMAEKNLISAGYQTYVFSAVNDTSKFSKKLRDCIGVIASGQDKETGKDISFLSHNDPEFFLKRGQRRFLRDLQYQLEEIKNRCFEGTIDAVIVGGNYFPKGTGGDDKEERENEELRIGYHDSIELLSREVKEALGFEPVIIAGPKEEGGGDDIFYRNDYRRLYLFRPAVGDVTSENYLPKDYDSQEKKWIKK